MLSSKISNLQHGPYYETPASLIGLKVMRRTLHPGEIRQIHLTVRRFLDSFPYNRISLKFHFLMGLLKPEEVLMKSFLPEDFSMGGGCVEMCLALKQSLPPDLPFCIIPSKLPARYRQRGLPHLNHTALALAWKEPKCAGYRLLLIDPGFGTIFPVLSFSDLSEMRFFELELDVPTKLIDYEDDSLAELPLGIIETNRCRKQIVSYQMAEILNPVRHIMDPFILSDLRPSLVLRGKGGGHAFQLKVHLQKGYVQMRMNGGIEKISFHSESLEQQLRSLAENSRFFPFKMQTIANQVMHLIRNRNILYNSSLV